MNAFQIVERQEIHKEIDSLSDASTEKLAHFISFLRYEDAVEAMEDAEDIAYAEAHKEEATVPLSEVKKDYETKYGSLD